jgi:hypothetical protein
MGKSTDEKSYLGKGRGSSINRGNRNTITFVGYRCKFIYTNDMVCKINIRDIYCIAPRVSKHISGNLYC